MNERLLDLDVVEEYFPSLVDRGIDVYDYNYKCLWVKLIDGTVYFVNKMDRSTRLVSKGADGMTEERYLKEFSINLRHMLRNIYMTQKRLSELTGISRPTISRMINGEKLPSVYQIRLISEATGYPVHLFTNFYDLAR